MQALDQSLSEHLSRSPRLWFARLALGTAFAALMVYEWVRWPNGSALLGPFGLIWYNGWGPGNFLLCAVSLAMLFAFLIYPHSVSAAISLIGLLHWLIWGGVAQGIGC